MKILLNAYDTTVKRLAGHPNLGQLATPSNRPSGLPAAFVAQDGLRFDDVPWRYIACLFVGGSTEFKLGPIAREAIGIAQSGGLLVHVGRVNSYGGCRVFTDEATAYGDLALTHIHKAVDHSRCYAIGEVHINSLENFWTLLKRSLGGTYVSVAPFHLYRYVAEQVWRFNNRETDDGTRFQRVLSAVVGKRLTYRLLTNQGDAGFMGIT